MALELTDSALEERAAAMRNHSMDALAPRFRAAVEVALAECHARSIDVIVFETARSEELQALYFANGRSHAQSALHSWHAYGLAVDVVSREHGWKKFPDGALYEADPFWWREVYASFTHAGLDAGADWHSIKDFPHFQWGKCKPSPSDHARELFASGGKVAVWQECGAT
jgi:hypothetical protein